MPIPPKSKDRRDQNQGTPFHNEVFIWTFLSPEQSSTGAGKVNEGRSGLFRTCSPGRGSLG